MGGDHAPFAIIEGAVEAARDYGIEVILVGNEEAVSKELSKYNISDLPITLKHASQTIYMHEPSSTPLRKKKDSSIRVATEMVKRGDAEVVISAGHTGATMATAFFVLGPLPGVERPAIATFLPTLKGLSIMLDVGATVDCKPIHLLQFALMGDVYSREILNKENPKIGLLSIGEEDTKGNELTRETFKLLKDTPLNFIGNVEGRDIFIGKADVIVCDGFIGNIALKISEGLADTATRMLKREIAKTASRRLGYFLLRHALKRFKKRTDYSEYGGAPLLGINGICIIGHGRSSAKAIKNALQVALDFSKSKINDKIRERIALFFQPHRRRKVKRFSL